ncbi:hypothetical protein JX265_012854 [Neoarthrinium moseri]|uniref:C2H2-type domain-containing protein n=1 Tax=Neoarthrinium moseri TaxID=1658444 RepID=A0A9P9W9T0_9PEZI|nr:hypothetical protein JX265_012854 [Neoarthrinium moseri]
MACISKTRMPFQDFGHNLNLDVCSSPHFRRKRQNQPFNSQSRAELLLGIRKAATQDHLASKATESLRWLWFSEIVENLMVAWHRRDILACRYKFKDYKEGSSTIYHIFQYFFPGERHRRAFLGILQTAFELEQNQPATLTSSNIPDPKRASLKRDRSSLGEVDSGFDQDSTAPSTKRSRARGALSSRGFACHFYKRFPSTHVSCLGYHFAKLKDENQHLHRCHLAPEYYCPVCGDTFATQAAVDRHIALRTCEHRHVAFHGVTTAQAQSISRILRSRGRTDEARWYDVWSILFPGCPPPLTPYRADLQTEITSQIQVFYRQSERQQMIEARLRQSGLIADAGFVDGHNPEILTQAVRVVMGCFDMVIDAYHTQAQEERAAVMGPGLSDDDNGLTGGDQAIIPSSLDHITPVQLQRPNPTVSYPADITHQWVMDTESSAISHNPANSFVDIPQLFENPTFLDNSDFANFFQEDGDNEGR